MKFYAAKIVELNEDNLENELIYEYKLLKTLNHPNIIHPKDMYKESE